MRSEFSVKASGLLLLWCPMGFQLPFLQEYHYCSRVEEWSGFFFSKESRGWHVDFLVQKEKVFSRGKSVASKVIWE